MTMKHIWPAFAVYVLVSVVHVWALFAQKEIHAPTKLLLMPFLALAVLVTLSGQRGVTWKTALLLIAGILFSWLGDGAATFFPMFEDELPMMLASFGIAHLIYMWVFWKSPGVKSRTRLPRWSVIYAVAYIVLMVLLVPHTGVLTIPVILYGLVLVGTATLASLVSRTVAWGGFWFLVSDAILAFRIFTPETMPQWTSGMVMVTYTLGQLLITYGVTRRILQHAVGQRGSAVTRSPGR